MPNLCAKFFLVFFKTCVYLRWTQIVFSVKFESVVFLFLTGIIQEKSGENEEEGERERENVLLAQSDLHDDQHVNGHDQRVNRSIEREWDWFRCNGNDRFEGWRKCALH
jgi:hypothetical protein